MPDAQLADADNEQHILECGREIEQAMGRWEKSGNFADRADAAFWLRKMNEAIASRSPAQIARMQAAQAQRISREPGATHQ